MPKDFGLSKDEITQTAALLAKLEPGYLPFEIFLQVYRLTPSPTLQIIPLRWGAAGEVEVQLVRRPADDPLWPNMWHNPGTVLRAGDTFGSSTNRLFDDDLGSFGTAEDLIFVENMFHTSDRGSEIILLYRMDGEDDEPSAGKFFAVDALPKDIIASEVSLIRRAAADFKRRG